MACDTAFAQARIDALQARIVAYEDALTGIATGAIESYTIDTGQTEQKVTKINIHTLRTALDNALNQHDMWCNRLNGGGSFYGQPSC
jgi:hypothetical protein